MSDEHRRTPRAQEYSGPTGVSQHERGVDDLEVLFDKSISFDNEFVEMLERAETGDGQARGLDLGSGTAAAILEMLLSADSLPKTRSYLQKHPNSHLQLTGLTDAPSPDLLMAQRAWTARDVEKLNARLNFMKKPTDLQRLPNLTGENRYYSLTRNQTLKSFLESVGISTLDLIWAAQSLIYLSNEVFKDTVTAAVDRLVPGGKMILSGVAGMRQGYAGTNTELKSPQMDEDGPMRLADILNENIAPLSTIDRYDLYKYRSHTADSHVRHQAYGLYKRLGVLSNDEIDIAELAIARNGTSDETKRIVNKILSDAHRRLLLKQVKHDYETRLSFLHGLPNVRVDLVYEPKRPANTNDTHADQELGLEYYTGVVFILTKV